MTPAMFLAPLEMLLARNRGLDKDMEWRGTHQELA